MARAFHVIYFNRGVYFDGETPIGLLGGVDDREISYTERGLACTDCRLPDQ
jgi:hypothetical protein